ncbi:energy transducer TonB [Saccharicrinis sp. FJH62]|uniref:energy transducer TonB n=1 Tax=Saccharicrinis sp. FJH62 TaxID=3344657 RepID=UPI0035D470B5
MKKAKYALNSIIILIYTFFIGNDILGQTDTTVVLHKNTIGKVNKVVDKMPEYPGGYTALFDYLVKNLRYPQIAMDNSIEGKVYIRFVVDENGYITDPQIVRGVDPALDREALRLVNNMPQWTPGEHQGKKVKVYYLLPINYQLQ